MSSAILVTLMFRGAHNAVKLTECNATDCFTDYYPLVKRLSGNPL